MYVLFSLYVNVNDNLLGEYCHVLLYVVKKSKTAIKMRNSFFYFIIEYGSFPYLSRCNNSRNFFFLK